MNLYSLPEEYMPKDSDDEEASAADATMREASRANGIDRALRENDVDVLLGPGGGNLYSLSAAAGER